MLQENDIKIGMDGRGRVLDNIFVGRLWGSVKHEDIYPKSHASMPELLLSLAEYFDFYNGERYHQASGYKTPDQVYRTGGEGGGAKIVDYFGNKQESPLQRARIEQLASAGFMDQAYNLILEGGAGKTHLATTLILSLRALISLNLRNDCQIFLDKKKNR